MFLKLCTLDNLQLNQLKDLLKCRFSNANVPINKSLYSQGKGLCILEIYILFIFTFWKTLLEYYIV